MLKFAPGTFPVQGEPVSSPRLGPDPSFPTKGPASGVGKGLWGWKIHCFLGNSTAQPASKMAPNEPPLLTVSVFVPLPPHQ